MSRILTFIIGILFSITLYGQDENFEIKVSLQDSILLNDFWTKFKTAINTNDKVKLATLCKFPFSCRPCIDDATLKHNDHVTITVTKKIFYESQYKLFFDKLIKNKVNKHKNFEIHIFFQSFDDRNKPNGFMFPYTIVAPSKEWEGLQGFIYLYKIKGKYLITGIDTVP